MTKSRLDRKKMGQNIQCLRLEHGWSQSELAVRAAISTSQMSRLERGVSGISVMTFIKLCEALGCRPLDILKGAE